jgi:hypothetical protein
MGYSAAEKRAVLRAVAADLRGPGADSEAEQLAATLQRVSDLYDPAEERSPEGIFRDMARIFRAVQAAEPENS